jgi:hypothetical protein
MTDRTHLEAVEGRATWTGTLESIADDVAEIRSALASGEGLDLVERGDLPDGLGALPPALEELARRVLHDSHELEDEIRDRLERLGDELLEVRSAHEAGSRPPAFVDARL